jgi:hypothetical protein
MPSALHQMPVRRGPRTTQARPTAAREQVAYRRATVLVYAITKPGAFGGGSAYEQRNRFRFILNPQPYSRNRNDPRCDRLRRVGRALS